MVVSRRSSEENNTMCIILFVLVGAYVLFQTILGLFEAFFLAQFTNIHLDASCQAIWTGHLVGFVFDLSVPFISGLSVIVAMTIHAFFRKKMSLKNILISISVPQIIQFVYAFWSLGSFESTVRLCEENLKDTVPQLWAAIVVHFFTSCIFVTFGVGLLGYRCIKLQNSDLKNVIEKNNKQLVQLK